MNKKLTLLAMFAFIAINFCFASSRMGSVGWTIFSCLIFMFFCGTIASVFRGDALCFIVSGAITVILFFIVFCIDKPGNASLLWHWLFDFKS